MKITSIALFRYLPFLLNEVELLELDITTDVQNIIGSNGSGKTSLLRELNPLPASRSDFGKDGYKHIELVHEGIEYRLESNFSNPSKPHSFMRDGTELNSSGTSSIQSELVRGELGYTPQVHSLCYGEHHLSKTRAGLREDYLLKIHPCQMRMLLDKHKKTERRLRAFRDNLSLLLERQTAISQQLIEPSLRETLQIENTTLTNELANVVGAIHKLTNQKQNILKSLSDCTPISLVRSTEDRKHTRRVYPMYTEISRDVSHETYTLLLNGEISGCQTRLTDMVNQIRTLTAEIDKYETYIRHSDAQGAIDVIEASLQTLQLDIAALQTDGLTRPFEAFYVEDVPAHISRMADLLAPFMNYTEVIPSTRDVQRMQTKYDNNLRQLASCEREESILSHRRNQIEARLKERILEQIPATCHGCVLFQQYSTTIGQIQRDYTDVDHEIDRVQRTKRRLIILTEGRQTRLNTYRQIVPHLQKLEQYLTEYRFLMIPLSHLNFLATLRQNPSTLLVLLQSHYEQSRNYHLRLKKQEELSRRTADYERLKTPSEFGRQFLETMIVEKKVELDILRSTHQQISNTLDQKQTALRVLRSYLQELNLLKQEKQMYDQRETIETLRFDRDVCDQYLKVLESCKIAAVSRLTDIDRTLREQDGLLATLKEISNTIANITFQQTELKEIERALSPSEGIPYRYMVQFINDIIAIANPFISEVWTYPFEFIPIQEGAELNYNFPMRVGDLKVPDISECSEAQMDMADLVFRLAQIILLKQTHYALYMDEFDRGMDYTHKQNLLTFFKSLTEDDIVTQLFIIAHSAGMYGGVLNSNILVLNENNVILPPNYNENVTIQKYV